MKRTGFFLRCAGFVLVVVATLVSILALLQMIDKDALLASACSILLGICLVWVGDHCHRHGARLSVG